MPEYLNNHLNDVEDSNQEDCRDRGRVDDASDERVRSGNWRRSWIADVVPIDKVIQSDQRTLRRQRGVAIEPWSEVDVSQWSEFLVEVVLKFGIVEDGRGDPLRVPGDVEKGSKLGGFVLILLDGLNNCNRLKRGDGQRGVTSWLAILSIGKCRSCGNESENDKIFHFLKFFKEDLSDWEVIGDW